MTSQQEPWAISVPEAGRRLGISRSLAFESARRGELPTIRLGKRLLVPVRALEKMLEGKQEPSKL